MPKKQRRAATPPTWTSQFGEPRGERRDELMAASHWATRLVQHDGGQDVIVLPLDPGLAALDALQVPIADGHSLIGDYLNGKLLAVVATGWAQLWEFVPEVRVVPRGGWVVVPAPGGVGTFAASWLSLPPPQLTPSQEQAEGGEWGEEGEDETLVGLRPDSLRAVVSAGALDPRRLYEGFTGRTATCEAVTS